MKKMYSSGMILVLGWLLFLAGCGPLPPTHDYYVDTSGNDSNDCLSTDHACLTLAAAISKATPRSTIHVGAGDFPTNVTVDKYLAIAGTGVTTRLIAAADAPVMAVADAVHLSLTDLEIRGGDIVGGGPDGIDVNGFNIATYLLIKNVTIVNTNNAILSSHGSAVEVVDSFLMNNAIGINITGGTLSVTNTDIEANTISGIQSAAVATLDQVTVVHNAEFGAPPAGSAAISIFNVTTSSGSTARGRMTMTNSTVTANSEEGIDNHNPENSLTISASTISANLGPGIANAGMLAIDHSVVTSNWSGILNAGSGAHAQVSQTAIIRNAPTTADVIAWGMGLDNHGGATASLVNSTVSENASFGIENYQGNVALSYVTVVGNALGLRSQAAAGSSGAAATTVDNSIIALNGPTNCRGTLTGSDAPSVSYTGTNLACDDSLANPALGVDPLTNDGTTWINPLEATSQALDRASGSCPAVDQRGQTRPIGAACDIGAYELVPGHPLVAATPATETPTLPVLQLASPTPTAALLEIVTNTSTPTAASVPQLTLIENANCRKGPGSAYDVATSFVKGKTLDAVGRNADSSWWLAQIQPGSECWVGDSTVGKSGPVEQLAVVTAPPLPDAPVKFVNSYVCDAKKTKTLTVNLNWATVPGATGYRLFRNGTALSAFGSGTTTYTDNAPMGTDLTYAVEALNAYGHSGQVMTTVPACK